MADSETEETQPPKKKSPMPAVAVAVAGMLGVTAATMFVAPKVVASRAAAAIEAATKSHAGDANATNDGHGSSRPASSGGHGSDAPSGEFVELGNLLVNPAGSQGLRFLMVSVTFEVLGAKRGNAVDKLRSREAHLRDVVIGILAKYDLERLGTPGIRDSVKLELAHAVDSIFHVPVGVFMPQFVIN